MKFILTAIAGLASLAIAAPTIGNPFSPIPGYPIGLNSACLSDAQARFIVGVFENILSNPDRAAAAAAASVVATAGYTDYSDSLNIVLGTPLGTPTILGRTAFVKGVAGDPAIHVETLGVFHSCDRISWRWRTSGVGSNAYPVKGIETFYVVPLTGQVYLNYFEFNSIAVGVDFGATFTLPPPATSAAAGAAPAALPAAFTSITGVPGYPRSLTPGCLSDSQAQFIANAFQYILSTTDRKQAAITAYGLGDVNYTDWSDSISILLNDPLGQPETSSNTEFAEGAYSNPPQQTITYEVFHDCTHISWRWSIIGVGKLRVNGISNMDVNPRTGRVSNNYIEFNSAAYNVDLGGTFKPAAAAA